MISEEVAIQAARDAAEGRVEVPAEASARVERSDGELIVVFPMDLPPGTRGPDYYARVTVDADTGEVLQILGG